MRSNRRRPVLHLVAGILAAAVVLLLAALLVFVAVRGGMR
jgi:hypothetical protein